MMHHQLLLSISSPLAALVLLLLFTISEASSTTTTSSSSRFYYNPTKQYPTPSILNDGILPFLTQKWSQAQHIALLEQAVEDHNAEYVAIASSSSNPIDAICYRRCIVLPLDERFDPPVGVFSHGHVDTGDKMSLSRNFWDAITRSKAEVSYGILDLSVNDDDYTCYFYR